MREQEVLGQPEVRREFEDSLGYHETLSKKKVKENKEKKRKENPHTSGRCLTCSEPAQGTLPGPCLESWQLSLAGKPSDDPSDLLYLHCDLISNSAGTIG